MKRQSVYKSVALAAVLLCLTALAGVGLGPTPGAEAEETQQRVIAATGEVTINVKPDIAYVTLGVMTQAATAAEAQEQNAAAMNRVMAAITRLGVTTAEVRTSRFNMTPVYDSEPEPKGQPRLVGYRVDNMLHITVKDLTRVGTVLDECVKAGANQIESVVFSLKDAAGYRVQALEEAVRVSRQKAEAMAKGLGLTITGVKSVQEVSSGPRYGIANVVMFSDEIRRGSQSVVAPGQIEVRAEVRVEYTY